MRASDSLVPLALTMLVWVNSPYMRGVRRTASPAVRRAALAQHAAAIVGHDRILHRRPLSQR